ncbi:SMP-30/gluconolactonase/LRE family protein [Rhizobium leucaenae]|uniref:Sugar lactone lactonase YvrE n=1 Tax=Rhizobium leucaenae TaxID=29450 RepID=A0A7W7EK92_9HYPH|nr:SMP-30/gluconolactonase/LRE family protein [Rhizobium leucaenae]MBB4566973.1 sugar lactone lactonase YvrE [Rhizobium leucaenae]MBB6300783.1 sugar lactone lactonase YvrE [Rhizobium leucaenae]
MTPAFEVFSDRRGLLGESPVWSEDGKSLWWVDTDGCRLLRSDAASGGTEFWHAPEAVGCIAMRPDGMLLAGLASGIFLFDPASGRFDTACSPESRRDVRFNDGAVDPAGRFWAGTMHLNLTEPTGAIFCVETDLGHRRVFDGLWVPNGLAFDPARNRMYFSDSHPTVQTIWVCDYDLATGTPSNRRVFATTHDFAGRPDGAFIDEDGIYWIAGVGGSQLLRFAPSGKALEPIPFPVTHPTKIIMDKANPRSVFVTTRRTAAEDETHSSGHVLRAILP